MYGAFQAAPVLTPYRPARPRIALDEKNDADAWGAAASAAMDLAEADLAPELELNDILWKSVKGKDGVMPPPFARRSFVRSRRCGTTTTTSGRQQAALRSSLTLSAYAGFALSTPVATSTRSGRRRPGRTRYHRSEG